jgi:hypothetical protein
MKSNEVGSRCNIIFIFHVSDHCEFIKWNKCATLMTLLFLMTARWAGWVEVSFLPLPFRVAMPIFRSLFMGTFGGVARPRCFQKSFPLSHTLRIVVIWGFAVCGWVSAANWTIGRSQWRRGGWFCCGWEYCGYACSSVRYGGEWCGC